MNRTHLTLLALIVSLFIARAAAAGDFASEMLDATFKLSHPDSTATCFLVRRDDSDKGRYLVTAAHTLEKTKGETVILVLRKAKPDGSFERVEHKIQVRRENKPLWVRHEKQDAAALRLVEPLPVNVPALPMTALADEAKLKAARVHICSSLFVLTFPQRFEANPAGFPVARQGIFASPPLLPAAAHPTFHGDFTTFAGDSGGPVFIDGGDQHPIVVGIVIAQSNIDERSKSEYEERMVRRPLGLGIILHASYLRETVEAAAKRFEKEQEAKATKPGENKPGETKPSDTKPGETKPK